MALEKEISLDTLSTRETTTSYINIPRELDEGFFTYPNENQYVFPVNFWMSQQTREDYRTDKTKKPVRVVTVRMLDCTQEDIDGTPGVAGEFDEEGNRISESIPAKIGLKQDLDKDTYVCSYHSVIDQDELDDYIYEHMKDVVGGQKLGVEKARKLGVVDQFYRHLKTVEDFAGEDMTVAVDIPPQI